MNRKERERAHLKMHVGVEDLGLILHCGWYQRVLVWYPNAKLKHASLIRRVLGSLHYCTVLSFS